MTRLISRFSISRVMAALAITVAVLSLQQELPAATVTWDGPDGGTWDESTANWTGDSTTYTNGDDAQFHGTIGTQGEVVVQAGGVSPASILIPNGGAGTWNFTGGDITGSGGISSLASGADPTWSRDGSYSFTGGVLVRGTYTYAPQLTAGGGTHHLGSDGGGGGGDITFDGGSFAFNPSLAATLDNNFILSGSAGTLSANANASFSSSVTMGNNLEIQGAADYSGLTLQPDADRTLTLQAVNTTTTTPTEFDGDVVGASASTLTINITGGGGNAGAAVAGPGGWDLGGLRITGARRLMFQGDGDTFFDQLAANGGKVTLDSGARLVNDINGSHVSIGTLDVGYPLELLAGTTVEGNTVNVNDGGALSGVGSVQAVLNVNDGGTLSPGVSPGTLTVENDLTMNGGSTLLIEADSAISHDALALTGSATVMLNDPTLSLNFGFTPTLSDTLFILTTADDATPISGNFEGLPEGSQVIFGGLQATISYLGEVDTVSTSGGNDVVLFNFEPAPVPEPSALSLLALIGLALTKQMRRRTRR